MNRDLHGHIGHFPSGASFQYNEGCGAESQRWEWDSWNRGRFRHTYPVPKSKSSNVGLQNGKLVVSAEPAPRVAQYWRSLSSPSPITLPAVTWVRVALFMQIGRRP